MKLQELTGLTDVDPLHQIIVLLMRHGEKMNEIKLKLTKTIGDLTDEGNRFDLHPCSSSDLDFLNFLRTLRKQIFLKNIFERNLKTKYEK